MNRTTRLRWRIWWGKVQRWMYTPPTPRDALIDLEAWSKVEWPALDYGCLVIAEELSFDEAKRRFHNSERLNTLEQNMNEKVHSGRVIGRVELSGKEYKEGLEKAAVAHQRAGLNVDDVLKKRLEPGAEPGVTFGEGKTAKRSARGWPTWMIPHEILRLVGKRFFIGRKYGVNNWKRAAYDKDIEFIRAIFDHLEAHQEKFLNFFEHAEGISTPGDVTQALAAAGYISLLSNRADFGRDDLRTYLRSLRMKDLDRYESRLDHAISIVWNAIALAWYEYWHPELTAMAFYNDWRGEKMTRAEVDASLAQEDEDR